MSPEQSPHHRCSERQRRNDDESEAYNRGKINEAILTALKMRYGSVARILRGATVLFFLVFTFVVASLSGLFCGVCRETAIKRQSVP